MNTCITRTVSLLLMSQGLCLAMQAQAEGFPTLNRLASGFGYYGVDQGFDDKLKIYGTVDAFASYHDSQHHSGFQMAGGGAWTNKLGVYARKALDPDTVMELDVEEGFNLNGKALEGTWDNIGTLRLATLALRSRSLGRLEFGKTYGVGTPTYADPFLAAYGSPYTFLSIPAAGKGAYYLDLRPKHTLAYTSPSMNGFSLATALSFGFDDVASQGRTVRGGGAKLQYRNSRVMLLGSYNLYYSDPWDDGGSSRQTANHYTSLSAFYDFGPLATSLTWQRQDVDQAGTPTTTVYTFGLMAPVGKLDVLRLAVVQRMVSAREKDALGVVLGYDHFFNPRWAAYARLGVIANQGASSVTYAGTPVDQVGDDPSNISLGMYYHF
ncbi:MULTISPECIES: porin [Pseudomonas]|uniref:porin n=1 Tax=Pseudomonas TaxID=286 RepID=UPI001574191D|nr:MULTISPECIES: porin [Pseudomonas]MBG6127645.1 putative porin [Pseudomonas sp. M2]NSX20755.1 porin [Pseudomonas putida]HDS1744669.1 porin [Pseudomonas putida]